MNHSILLISFLFLFGCVSTKTTYRTDQIDEFKKLTLQQAFDTEKKLKSEDISLNRRIGLGKGIYPNENNYELEISKTFKRIEKPNFSVDVDYHFTKDSSIRVILYEWNDLKKKQFGTPKENTKRRKVFESKFNELRKELTNELGEPFFSEIESKNNPIEGNFRDGIKWTKNGKNAYLFTFGNDKNSYNQIRLSIYWD